MSLHVKIFSGGECRGESGGYLAGKETRNKSQMSIAKMFSFTR